MGQQGCQFLQLQSEQVQTSSSDSDDLQISQENFDKQQKIQNQISSEKKQFQQFIEQLLNEKAQEGMISEKGSVPIELKQKLMKSIDQFKDSQEIKDYHPGSNNMVRDIIHQSLFPYQNMPGNQVQQQNPETEKFYNNLQESYNEDNIIKQNIFTDFFGREFCGSLRYQWLPSNMEMQQDGKYKYTSYINNLPEQNVELKENLQELFNIFVPKFQQIFIEYLSKIKFSDWEEEQYFFKTLPCATFSSKPEVILDKMKKLQVITKIVDYEMYGQDTYNGVWHVEGMSHENIIATGVYFINIDKEIEGGQLYYKRNFTKDERVFLGDYEKQIIEDFSKPLGSLKTEEDLIIAFPNSHIHRLGTIKNVSQDKNQCKKRRIIAFFIVNPFTRIISTQTQPEQQGQISYQQACDIRLSMMEQRRYVKVKLNSGVEKMEERTVNLCEH
ncbi:hypothetical protein PPERSA_04049 [Pseudocohnilembus persalinus]|uniref:DUF4246 domain-containing protein n=1 Tax=Pseudocohnilembus persalinus TaxID=266149 RepID=A0A0V0QKV1_PSEPJ|nr:hypothetical protein PPERSA_04049 [Pseudocohnilembus persalinus]|eukprot:KRX02846.1 hypothetical protein PPERSA_04049 [Pseudocohnilembus persalinus]